jgi:thiamine-phosphate diphosphorylase
MSARGALLAAHLPALVFVADVGRAGGRDLAAVARAAVDGGANAVQLRAKGAGRDTLLHLGVPLREATRGRALFFVNGDADIAVALGADGVHLPAHGTTVAQARAVAGDDVLISVAAHSLEEALAADSAGADAIQVGSVFASASHPGGATLGLDELRAICGAVRVPAIAVGGITPDNARDVMRAGAAGIAVIGAIMDAADPHGAARLLRDAIAVEART